MTAMAVKNNTSKDHLDKGPIFGGRPVKVRWNSVVPSGGGRLNGQGASRSLRADDLVT